MQKMMYICPVDWLWIKQRPQFLAEELNAHFNVHVFYPYKNNRKGLQKKTKTNVKLTPWFSLPTFGGRFKSIEKLNVLLSKVQMTVALRCIKPDILWLSMPWQIRFFPKKMPCKIVYDCMDDYPAISKDQTKIETLMKQEEEIVRHADFIFASSENLRNLLVYRYGVEREHIQLLRNGYNAKWIESEPKTSCNPCDVKEMIQIGYFGTIGRWFDFELLLHSLENCSQIEYHLFGPLEAGIQIPFHDRLIYRGVVEHDKIRQQADMLDALMMPFQVNDIVKSVDPVKLYEYIWMGKHILCVYYPEIERFDPFVRFYRTKEEYMKQLEAIIEKEEIHYTNEQAVSFLAENNWKKRAEQVNKIITEKYNDWGRNR